MSKFMSAGASLKKRNFDFERKTSSSSYGVDTPNSVVGSHFFKQSNGSLSGFFSDFVNKKDETPDENTKLQMIAKKTEGYVFRALSDFQYKMLINDYIFTTQNKNAINEAKAELLWSYFSQILLNSSYIFETFMEEILKNFFHGNVYVQRKYKESYVSKLLVMPSIGWKELETVGSTVTKFSYTDPNKNAIKNTSNSSKVLTHREVYHLKFNHETHESFGTPLLLPILDDVSSVREAENFDLENFLDASKSTHYTRVGEPNAPGTKLDIDDIINYYARTKAGDHMVINGKARIETLSTPRIDGASIIGNYKNRIFVGSGASKSAMGDSSLGRQTADTENENTNSSVSTFQNQICNQLNNTLFLELNKLLFPNEKDLKNFVFLKPNDPFDILERKEKHAVFLWQGAGIDQANFEKRIGVKLDIKKTYPKLFEAPANTGSISQLSSPANQHTKKTSSKKSKKD